MQGENHANTGNFKPLALQQTSALSFGSTVCPIYLDPQKGKFFTVFKGYVQAYLGWAINPPNQPYGDGGITKLVLGVAK